MELKNTPNSLVVQSNILDLQQMKLKEPGAEMDVQVKESGV
jgi:hypothetical protein